MKGIIPKEVKKICSFPQEQKCIVGAYKALNIKYKAVILSLSLSLSLSFSLSHSEDVEWQLCVLGETGFDP